MYATTDSIKPSLSGKWEIHLYSGRTVRDYCQGLGLRREVWGMKNFKKQKFIASEEINPPFLWELEVESELGEHLNNCKKFTSIWIRNVPKCLKISREKKSHVFVGAKWGTPMSYFDIQRKVTS